MRTVWSNHDRHGTFDLEDLDGRKKALAKFRASGRSTGIWPEMTAAINVTGRAQFKHQAGDERRLASTLVYHAGHDQNFYACDYALRVQMYPGRFVQAMLYWRGDADRGHNLSKDGPKLTAWATVPERWKRSLGDYHGEDLARWR